ncbi:MAG: MFS transporter [Gammaproteobacteria bacterium]|nr:MFS transporter [Gammaproteobacteria bacterium]
MSSILVAMFVRQEKRWLFFPWRLAFSRFLPERLKANFLKMRGLWSQRKRFVAWLMPVIFFVSSPMQLYGVQICLGVAGAFQAPAMYSLYHQHMPKKNATFYWGIWTGFYNISIGTGAFISAFVVHRFGFYAMFGTLLSVSILGLLMAIYTRKNIHIKQHNNGDHP